MKITKISLKRTKESKWENAILIEGLNELIIDKDCNVVLGKIWNYERDNDELTIDITQTLAAKNFRM